MKYSGSHRSDILKDERESTRLAVKVRYNYSNNDNSINNNNSSNNNNSINNKNSNNSNNYNNSNINNNNNRNSSSSNNNNNNNQDELSDRFLFPYEKWSTTENWITLQKFL